MLCNFCREIVNCGLVAGGKCECSCHAACKADAIRSTKIEDLHSLAHEEILWLCGQLLKDFEECKNLTQPYRDRDSYPFTLVHDIKSLKQMEQRYSDSLWGK